MQHSMRRSMQRSMRWATSLLLVVALTACGSEDEEEEDELPEVDCSGEVPTFGEVTAFSEVCTNCHSTSRSGDDRHGAPAAINWDDYDSAKAHAMEAVEEVSEGEMPPESSGETLTADEKEELYTWALCGTPE